MGFTQQEIDSFHRFAVERLSNGGPKYPLEECLRMWRIEQEQAGAIADIQAGIDDERAGRLRPLREVDAEIRRELGLMK